MNKFFLIILFLTLFFNVNSQVCGTCTNADCGNMINKTGPTADVDLKAVLNYKFPTPPPSQAYKFDPDPLMGKNGPFTFSACYEIYVTSSSQTVGIAIKPIYSTPTSGGNLPFTGELKKLGQCSSAPITPNNTIPSVSSATESIPSITEWTNLPIGTYVYCINTSVPAGFNLKSVLLGSYVKGGTTTSNECSDCNTASCDIAGPYSDFATAVLGEKISDATDNHCSKKVSLSSSPVKTPNKYTSYYKVKTSSTATMLGIIISNGTGKLPGETNPCGVAVRTATLYPITGCTSSGVSGSTTSNITDFFNREWTGLTSGTEYIIKVETTAPSGCQIQDQCASYYTPGAITPLPCGTVGINWRNAANTPSNTDLTTCKDKDFELKANSVIIAQQDIAPGFLIDNDFGKINLTKIELDQGQTGNYINTNLVKDITFCSPNVGYNVRLTGSVISPGSGIIRIIDHATGQDLYVGPFTNGMVIPINAGTLKGTAIFSGPGVSNHRLNYPSAGSTSYIAAGYGIFNPSKAGNGTHTISYSWNNGNQDCGTATMQVIVAGCTQPVCKTVAIDLYDDDQISTVHTNKTFSCSANPVYLAPKDVQTLYFDQNATPDNTWPFPMVRVEFSAVSGNGNVLSLNVNFYDPISGSLIESTNLTTEPKVTHYFARQNGYNITLKTTDNSSGTFNYTAYDVMTGAVIGTGTITVTSGVESAKSAVIKPTNFNGAFTCATCGTGALIQGINPYIDEIGIGTFDPKKAGVGTHDIIYTWDNGLTGASKCSGSSKIQVIVNGGPTISPSISDVCFGSTTTKFSYSTTGSPTTYSIDWNAAANTAGLVDVSDANLSTTSPMNINIPGTLLADTYTGSLTVKNASGCSSAPQTVSFKVNPSPTTTGLTTICQGTTVEWTSTAPLTSSDNTNYFATITPSGTVNKYNVTASNPTTTPTSLKFTATLAGCSVEKEITIIKKPDITGTKSFCEEGNTTLACLNPPATATAAWSLTTASSIATVDNTGKVTGLAGQSGNVDITYTDDKGCTNSVTVTVNPNLVPTVTCGTSTATSVTFNWGTVSGATSYDLVYNKDNTGNQTVSGHTTTSYPVSNVPSGKSVTLIVTPKGTGCYKASAVKSCTADNCPSPTITKDPDNVAKCAGANTSFSVTATSTATLSYQWQINNGTNPPTNLTNTGVYTGTTDPTLLVSNVTGLDGVKYQCLVTETSSGTGCNKTSLPATLTVNPIPAFTPTVSDICEGSDPSIAYTGLTGNPDRIVFDPGLPLITPFNLSISPSPITVTGLPIKLPVNTYSGVKVRVENTTTGCKSADITITPFKVQATQKPSISSKSTTVNSVTFQWSNLTGLNTQTGGEDKFTVKEFICSGCATAGTYVNATGNLTYNVTSSKWEYEKTGLSSGDKVFIEVTPLDNIPLATPSCYGTSSFELLAIPCVSPIITQDIIDVSLCEGTTTTPVSTSFELKYNTAASTSPATWEILSPGGSWTTLNASGVYSISGSDNVDTKLTISDIKGLDGTKYRVNLKTGTASGSCNTISHESILTVKPLPVMSSISDKSFCPGTLVNDPSKPLDFEFKVSQAGTPTFTWNSDVQTTGVSTGGTDVTSFASFTTLSPLNDEVSKITVTPKLNLCVGQPITFNITVKPTVKPVFTNSVIDFKSVQFNWASSSVTPDFWVIDTLITSSTAATPSLTNYKSGGQQLGTVNTYSIGGINSTKKAYISITPKQDPSKTTLFCPVVDGLNEIPTPCVKPTKPANPTVNPLCEGAALTVNGVLPDATANFQWKISSDAGITWNNVSFSDFGNTGTTNILSTQLTKAYMNNALVKVVLTDKITGLCTEESNTATIIINELPNVKLIQPTSTSLCVDDNDVSAFVQLVSGKSPLKIDYTLNGVQSKDQDIANLEIKFTAKNEMNYSLTLDKVTDANGCIFSLTGLTSQVSVHKNPSPKFVVSDTIGCYPLLINFTDISGEKYKEVTWDFGTGINSSKELGTTKFTYPKEGDYTVTYSVLNEFGCSGQIIKPDQIHVKSTPKAAITTDRNILSVYENVVKFDSKLSKNVSFYLWDFGDNSPISNDPVVEHKYDPSVPGKFKISLIVSNSSTNMTCSDTAVTWIDFPEEVVFFIPNTFTPNGDEFNNTFQPIFTSGYDPQNYSFIIFDRWGQVVFESNNPQVGWDGTHGDKILGNDTFVWKLGFKEKSSDNEHRSTGHVNLVK